MRISPAVWKPENMIGGNAALDFVNTASRWPAEPVDQLGGPGAFADWAAAAGLIDADEAGRIKAEIARDPEAAERLYKKAGKLREALWRIFSAVASGVAVDAGDLAALNEWTRRAARYGCLVAEKGGFHRCWSEEAPPEEVPLFAVAEAAEDLLEHGPLDRVHACGGEACDWMFVDLSKNGRRRWCSMATCGNEAKVRKYRTRKKKAA